MDSVSMFFYYPSKIESLIEEKRKVENYFYPYTTSLLYNYALMPYTISVVIPTYNRKDSLLRLLQSLNQSDYHFCEVIIVDSGDNSISTEEISKFENLPIKYVRSPPSVCVQRNKGIRLAKGDWIFLCDDDIEVPAGYISALTKHLQANKLAGAAAGLFLQKDDNNIWQHDYPVTKNLDLLYRFIFCLGIWGRIQVKKNVLNLTVIDYYKNNANHISKAGWPVLTSFENPFFVTPIYTLGAALVKKEWLAATPFEEVLDANGYGENYGVALSFQEPIHIVTSAFVHHHHEKTNRQAPWLTEQKRTLALDFFLRTSVKVPRAAKYYLLWSVTGKFIYHFLKLRWKLAAHYPETFWMILLNRNPYIIKKRKSE